MRGYSVVEYLIGSSPGTQNMIRTSKSGFVKEIIGTGHRLPPPVFKGLWKVGGAFFVCTLGKEEKDAGGAVGIYRSGPFGHKIRRTRWSIECLWLILILSRIIE